MAQSTALERKQPASRGLLSLSGDVRLLMGVLTISSYVNPGGEVFDLTVLFPSLVKRVVFLDFSQVNGRNFFYDPATKKVASFVAAGTEVTNTTNIGAVPFLAWVV